MNWIIKALKFIFLYRAVFQIFMKKPKVSNQTFEEQACDIYNSLTSKYKVKAVSVDESLVKACQMHAEWMSVNNKVSHVGSFGKTARQRAVAAGYKGMYVAEHVFICKNCDIKSALESMIDTMSISDDIRDNFRHFGIANHGRYWCVILAR